MSKSNEILYVSVSFTCVKITFIVSSLLYFIIHKILHFREAVFSDGGVANIRRYACLAHAADPHNGVLTSWSTAKEERTNQWRFAERYV